MIPIGIAPPFGAKIPQYTGWNPNDKGTAVTLSNGNLTATISNVGIVRSVIGKSSGKWYYEITMTNAVNSAPGIADSLAGLDTRPGFDAHMYAYQLTYNGTDGAKIFNSSASVFGLEFLAGDILGVKLDATAGTVEFLKNNSSQGTMTLTGLTPPYYAMDGCKNVVGSVATANFGTTAFAYAVPSGYNAGLYT